MAEKEKPREPVDSVWGEVARMEAEVNDPEEMETSVYDMRELAALGKVPPRSRLHPPRIRSPAAGDEEDDATDVLEQARERARKADQRVALGPVNRAGDEPLHEDDASKEPTETKVFERESSVVAAPPDEPAVVDESVAEPRGLAPNAQTDRFPRARSRPRAEALRVSLTFGVLVVIGFAIGYLVVAAFRLG